MSVTPAAASAIQLNSIQGMDVETALLAVHANRTRLLEAQLMEQVSTVQAKNNQLAKLNTLLGSLNEASAVFSSSAAPGDTLAAQDQWKDNKDSGIERRVNSAYQDAGITPDLSSNAEGGALIGSKSETDIKQRLAGGMRQETTKAQVDGAIQKVKAQIDGMGNTQQMDMLRLQSLSNKRNESFDVMTNFIKKMQDARSSIIGNMR